MKKKTGKRRVKKFSVFMQTNLLLLYVAVIIVFILLIVRIMYLNYRVGDKYEKRVLSQQTYMSNAIPYKRGGILDRNQTVLAKSIRVYNLILDPKKILSDKEYKKPVIDALKDCFQSDPKEVEAILEKKPKSQYVVFFKEVESKKVKLFQKIEKENKKIQGVWFEEDYKRIYPYNSLACDVVGFTTSGMSTGIESYYNDQLIGKDGREYGYFDSDLNLQRTVKSAIAGNDILTTLDVQIQSIVEKKVAQFNEETGSKNTAILVMNPKNGEIYAMTSEKQYDLNNPKDLTPFFSDKKIDAMSQEKKFEQLNKIWRNFVVSDMYEPGSTYKPVTVASALEEGVIQDTDEFYCPGYHVVKGIKIRCSSRLGHGTISLGESLMYSCNVALMEIGEKLGAKKFYKEQKNFMFGNRTGIDLPAETKGYIFTEEQLKPLELATSTFGQGFKCSMLQVAAADASLINGGYYIEPHILKSINSEQGAVIETKKPVIVRNTVSRDTSDKIREYLYQTVENGTATFAQIENYKIGGKTGTAEKFPRGNGKYLVSFIGFAPMEDPQVLIYVVIDEPNVEDQAHSTYATKLFHDVAEEIFPFLDIPKTKKIVSKVKENQKENEKEDKKEDEKENKEENESDSSIKDREEYVTPEGETNRTIGDETGVIENEENLPTVNEPEEDNKEQ